MFKHDYLNRLLVFFNIKKIKWTLYKCPFCEKRMNSNLKARDWNSLYYFGKKYKQLYSNLTYYSCPDKCKSIFVSDNETVYTSIKLDEFELIDNINLDYYVIITRSKISRDLDDGVSYYPKIEYRLPKFNLQHMSKNEIIMKIKKYLVFS